MSRRTFDPESEALLPPHGQPSMPAELRLPCRWCHTPTLRTMLAQYGARCLQCYEAYCREPQRSPNVGNKRDHGPKAWAHALRAREAAGERLSVAQRDMWCAALQGELQRQQIADEEAAAGVAP